MLSGHSFLPNDRDFSSIELAKKRHPTVYVPNEWYELVKGCHHKNPFVVSAMATENFVSVKSLTAHVVNRKQNNNNAKVNWLKILWLRVSRDNLYQFFYQYSLNDWEAWKVVNLAPKARGRPTNLGRVQLPQLCDRPCRINSLKVRDLQSLLQFVPPEHHTFYQNLIPDSEDSDTDHE